jgi:hypothetical protein
LFSAPSFFRPYWQIVYFWQDLFQCWVIAIYVIELSHWWWNRKKSSFPWNLSSTWSGNGNPENSNYMKIQDSCWSLSRTLLWDRNDRKSPFQTFYDSIIGIIYIPKLHLSGSILA